MPRRNDLEPQFVPQSLHLLPATTCGPPRRNPELLSPTRDMHRTSNEGEEGVDHRLNVWGWITGFFADESEDSEGRRKGEDRRRSDLVEDAVEEDEGPLRESCIQFFVGEGESL